MKTIEVKPGENIWGVARRLVEEAPSSATFNDTWTPPKPQGCVCAKCGEKNEYAEPNQPDGTYRCPSCRRYGRPW